MGLYAENTRVGVDGSKGEIERMLRRYGAAQFVSGWDETGRKAILGFAVVNRRVQFILPLPSPEEFSESPAGRARNTEAMKQLAAKELRRRWRSLALLIKAKLEAVASGITVFDEEFMAHIVMPGGRTVGQVLLPDIEDIYRTGKLPPLLPGYGETGKAGGA